jgi:hypothetical protein
VWTTASAKTVIISPRPVRVVYLVPNPPTHELLDILFNESMSRWGGRRTPIIPTDGRILSENYWNLLEIWDADIIYSYAKLDKEFHDRLAHRLAPASLIAHCRVPNDLRPDLRTNTELLRSISVLPFLARSRSFKAQNLSEVLDSERYADLPRDLADSFNFASNCHSDRSLNPHARRLSFKPPSDQNYAPRFSSPEEIRYLETIEEVEAVISDQRDLLCMSQLSDMFTPYLSNLTEYSSSWEEHLSIVVGDEPEDRMLFWNGIHRYNSLLFAGDIQLLRFSPDRFTNGIPSWILKLCSGQRNYRHPDHNHAPQTIFRSCSANEKVLVDLASHINSSHYNMGSFVRHSGDDVFEKLKGNENTNQKGGGNIVSISNWTKADIKVEGVVRFDRDQFELPNVVPFHLKGQSLGPTSSGAWAMDLRIDRNEDHSRYSNLMHRWMFPRRVRLESAVKVENYGKGKHDFLPLPRPTNEGDLALWDGLDWKRPLITMPSDLRAFADALARHHPEISKRSLPKEGLGLVYRFLPLALSDKGRDLLGVFQLFRSLPDALMFMTNPYLVSVIEMLCPTSPESNPERLKELSQMLIAGLEVKSDGEDLSRFAKRLLEKTAIWIHADNNENGFISYKRLIELLPSELKKGAYQKKLDDSVKYLRNQSFLWQGYGWRCGVCQHSNWVSLENVKAVVHCKICRSGESAPVSGDHNIHFRLNSFVAAAYSTSSSQGPVAWTLSRLAHMASWSFMFAPALNITKIDEKKHFTDIDVIAAVDGEVYLVEVKKSFSGVTNEKLNELIELATHFRPNYIGFSVQRPRAELGLEVEIERVANELSAIDVKFFIWASDDRNTWSFPSDIPLPFGDDMEWSAW